MSASLASRIEKRNAARIAKQATFHARALAYFTAHGDEAKAQAAERWLAENVRCRSCGRSLSNDESRRLGIGPECRKVRAA